MPFKKSLEQPIINAIIRYAYALREDEEAALLSAFLVISHHTHREAVEFMLPGEKYEQLMATPLPVTEAEESIIEVASDLTPREPLIIRHIRYVMTTAANLTGFIIGNIIVPVDAAITKHVDAAIARLGQSLRFMSRRHRESILQEEEELALFSTIQGVANQVNLEAFESEMKRMCSGKDRSVAAYVQADAGPWGARGVPVKEIIAARDERKEKSKRHGASRDRYIEFMDEELTITRGIIDRNRALSQVYLNANPV
jgi:hypothetical protein